MTELAAGGSATRWLAGLALALALAPLPLTADEAPLSPQQYVNDTWGPKDGLPEGPVLALLPARDGYLWAGTAAGLVRFDGVRFHVFEPGERGLGSFSFARHLAQTEDGAIWTAFAGGVACFQGGRFETFAEAQGLQHPFVYSLQEAPGGALWVGTGGSGVWQLRDGRFSHHPAYETPGLPAQVNDLATGRDGTLWVASGEGVVALGRTVRRFGTREGLGSAEANTLLVDHQGVLWVGTRAGLSRFTGDGFVTYDRKDGLSSEDVTALADDGQALWIGTRTAGLNRRLAGRIEPFAGVGAETGILSLAPDGDGSLWVGTDAGLGRYQVPPLRTFGRESGLADERILNVAARRAGGVWLLDGKGTLEVLDHGVTRVVAPPGTIPDAGMVPLVEDEDGGVWIGGTELRHFRQGRWLRYANPGGAFTVLLPDHGSLLVAQTAGDGTSTLSRLAGGRFERVGPAVPLVHVQRLFRDHAGRLWISTGGGGLVREGPDGTRVFRTQDGLPHDVVYGLAEDGAGSLWVGTRAGLARVRGDAVTSLATAADAPRRAPLHLECDGQGRLWVAAEDGIYALALAALDAFVARQVTNVPARRYTSADGLHSVEFSWRSPGHARSSDGRIWFATNRGVSVVDPGLVPLDPKPPPLVIEEVLLGERPAELADPVRVPPGSGDRLAIRFTAPTAVAADQLRFRFRLVGYQESWIEARNSRVASFTNVPPGAYTFEVQARRSEGSWGGASAVLGLEVEPHWHETLGARMVAAALAALALAGVYRLRLRQLEQRQRALAALVEERTHALSQEVGERRRAEETVRELNSQLELRVKERTAQLETANDALAQEKERLQVTIGSLAEGVITTDVAGRVVLMNAVAERHTGRRLAEATGRPLPELCRLVDRFDRRPLGDPAGLVLSSQAEAPRALTRALLLSHSGEEILTDASAAPIRDRQGQRVGAVLVLRDVTERTLAEEQIQKVQKLEALGVLAGGIAHDFNNLLTGVFGHIDLARLQLEGSPATRRLESALEVLDDARSLTRQLLTFSAGGRPATEPLGIGDLLRRSTRFVLSGPDHSAELDLPDELWDCEVDALQIRQAIDNVLMNARQAMPDGGTVRVRARNTELPPGDGTGVAAGRYVEIAISDEGAGIPPEIRERVFEPFFTSKPTGSGLGLTTAHSIVTQHGGAIVFDSTVGRGTTFRILLPAAERRRPTEAPPESPASSAGARILVMDDEPVLREIAKEALESDGHGVEVAAHGEEAVELLARALREGRPFDLAILDLTIAGGMGGIETLARLRELAPGLPAIATSGYASGPVLADPHAFGFDGSLPKPYSISDLSAVVDGTLRSRPA